MGLKSLIRIWREKATRGNHERLHLSLPHLGSSSGCCFMFDFIFILLFVFILVIEQDIGPSAN